jgi:hypothetical protein
MMLIYLSLVFLAVALSEGGCSGGKCQKKDALLLLQVTKEMTTAHGPNNIEPNEPDSVQSKLENLTENMMAQDLKEEEHIPLVGGEGAFGGIAKTLEFMHMKLAQLETALVVMELRYKQLENDTQVQLHGLETKIASCEEKLSGAASGSSLLQQSEAKQSQTSEQDHSANIMEATLKKHRSQLQQIRGKRSKNAKSLIPNPARVVEEIAKTSGNIKREIEKGAGDTIDALGDAYDSAKDKVAFIAETVIDTAEKAWSVLSRGFEVKASCDKNLQPDISIDDSKLRLKLGHQRCSMTLCGEQFSIIDINLGDHEYTLPTQLQTAIKVGKDLQQCAQTGSGAGKMLGCMAQEVGDALRHVDPFNKVIEMVQDFADCLNNQGAGQAFECIAQKFASAFVDHIPPFNILGKIGDLVQVFFKGMEGVAEQLVGRQLSKATALMQEAAMKAGPHGEEVVEHHRSKHLVVRSFRRQCPTCKQMPAMSRLSGNAPSMLQEDPEPGSLSESNVGGIVNLRFGEGPYHVQNLLTQFGGVEMDSKSCLAFAPRRPLEGADGQHGKVKQSDWQVGEAAKGKDEFIELKPWAVPCENKWLHDNREAWEGFSVINVEGAFEKCLAVNFEFSIQPVVALGGGIELEALPEPLIALSMTVCWPDKWHKAQVSYIQFRLSAGTVPVFTHTVRWNAKFNPVPGAANAKYGFSLDAGRILGNDVPDDDDKGLQSFERNQGPAAKWTKLKNRMCDTGSGSTRHPCCGDFVTQTKESHIDCKNRCVRTPGCDGITMWQGKCILRHGMAGPKCNFKKHATSYKLNWTSLLQSAAAANSSRGGASGQRQGRLAREKLELNMLRMDSKKGLEVQESLHGQAAARHLQKLYKPQLQAQGVANRSLGLAEADSQSAGEKKFLDLTLSDIAGSSNLKSIFDFGITGAIADGKLKMSVMLNLGNVVKTEKSMDMINFHDVLKSLLDGVPSLSPEERDEAVRIMDEDISGTDLDQPKRNARRCKDNPSLCEASCLVPGGPGNDASCSNPLVPHGGLLGSRQKCHVHCARPGTIPKHSEVVCIDGQFQQPLGCSCSHPCPYMEYYR